MTGPTEPTESAKPAQSTEAVALEQLNGELYAAIEAGDLDRMGRVWLDHPHQQDPVCVHPGWPPIQGRDQILRSWAAIMANTSYIQFFLTDVEVSIAGDVAVVTCAENILTAVGDTETESSALAGGHVVATNVFRRTPRGWRLWVHHASPVLAAHDGDVEED
jgi:ketosteroid isomerase-like protein